jgi:hypothetical protein
MIILGSENVQVGYREISVEPGPGPIREIHCGWPPGSRIVP